MFSPFLSLGLSLQPWQHELLYELFPQVVPGNVDAQQPRGGAGLLKRRSPKGFVLEPSAPQLLLPDGRLWHYHTRLSPEGIYYDARVDHTRSMHGSIPLGGDRFSFLDAGQVVKV